MSGEKDQIRLQQMMAPDLRPETYVYCPFQDHRLPVDLSPICTFRESEGLTAIVERSQAVRAKVPYIFEAKLITLTVHSSLEAIGFLALISIVLAKAASLATRSQPSTMITCSFQWTEPTMRSRGWRL